MINIKPTRVGAPIVLVNQIPQQIAVSKPQTDRRQVTQNHSLFSQLVYVQVMGILLIISGLLVPLTGCNVISQAEAEAETRRAGVRGAKKLLRV